jgi:hypothetical protein
MPVIETPLSAAAVRALWAGGVALLLWVLAAQASALMRLGVAMLREPRLRALGSARLWPYLGNVAPVAFAVAWLYLSLRLGYLDPLQIGLVPPAWEELVGWLPAVAGLTALWAALLWGAHWRQVRPDADRSPRATFGTPLGLPVHLVGEEAWAAILRGAVAPALGLYWGAWAAAVLRLGAGCLSPSVRTRHRDRAARPFTYLDWGMEWVAAAAFAVSGNLWASLIASATGHLTANLVHRALWLWAVRAARRGLADEAAVATLRQEEPPAMPT